MVAQLLFSRGVGIGILCFLLAFSSAGQLYRHGLLRSPQSERHKRLILGVAVTIHLLLLGTFKYLDFLTLSANRLAHLLGLQAELPFIEVILPVGISFFTLPRVSITSSMCIAAMSRCAGGRSTCCCTCRSSRSLSPGRSCGRRISCRSSSGPSARADPDRRRPRWCLIVGGLFKKVVIANYLATHPRRPGVRARRRAMADPTCLLGDFPMRVQIYCDFSAYTDMAIDDRGAVRISLSAQFRPAVPGAAAPRVLAALA